MKHLFDTEIAEKFHDANVAVLFENLCYWIAHNKANGKNEHEIEINGKIEKRTFTYNSLSAFCTLFPYWSKRQIENYLKKLKDANLIGKGTFNQKGFDRTAWYCLVDERYLSSYISSIPSPPATKPAESTESTESTELPISPNGEMEDPQTVKWMSPNGEMDVTKRGNGFHQNVTTIPFKNHLKTNLKTTATTELKKIILEKDNTLIFDDKFYVAAVSFLEKEKVTDWESYIAWLFEQVQKKKPNSLRNYFYSVFCLESNSTLFKIASQEQTKEIKKNEIECPVCHSLVNRFDSSCPECHFNLGYVSRPQEIEKHLRLFTLSPEEKIAYQRECEKLAEQAERDGIFNTNIQEKYKQLNQKYGFK